ncbi:hypothetical protein [Roseicyclus mahoneyensis]|uniref:hypothetical protein n=1 Tax=Roseicyclus mahoneyensis TaxID=164332 RepID=UPI0011B2780F|nr:hypothetical protein [Roseicyclus mahoneyensis]
MKIDHDILNSAAAWWAGERISEHLQEEDLARIWSTPWPELVQEVKRAASDPELAKPNAMIPTSHLGAMPPERVLAKNLFILPLALHLFSTETTEVRLKVNVVGLERLDEALTSCGRVCLLGGHVGPGLATSYVLNLLGYAISHQSRRNFFEGLKLPRYETIAHIPTGGFRLASLARAMADLESGRVLFTAADGVAGTSGRAFNFLGKSRQFQSGFGYTITRCKAEAIPVYARLDSDANLTIEFGDPLCPIADEWPDQDRQEGIAHGYVTALEKYWLLHERNVPDRQLRLQASRAECEPGAAAHSFCVRG